MPKSADDGRTGFMPSDPFEDRKCDIEQLRKQHSKFCQAGLTKQAAVILDRISKLEGRQ